MPESLSSCRWCRRKHKDESGTLRVGHHERYWAEEGGPSLIWRLGPKEKCLPMCPSNVLRLKWSKQGGITMSEFVFLYRGGEAGRSPERMQQTMQKWMAWLEELGKKGHIKDQGQPLERTGKLVKGKQKSVTDGPFAEVKDIVGGYTLIEARDLEQAVELSKGCPILERDGAVEVRPVMKLSM